MEINTKKLQIAMARRCMDTKDLSKKIGCTTTSIQQIVSGRRGVPIKKLGEIAKALGIDVTEILED